MALAIATNNAALNAAASASSVNRDMETSMARLSTGKRINSASDDAAGVAIASRLSSEIRGTDQAIRNSLDGQALIDTAEGAHKEIENILQRMREVAVQAANDTNNDQDRGNLQSEMDAMIDEIDRIAETTTWAGTNLMKDATSPFKFQVGTAVGTKNQIEVNIGGMTADDLLLTTDGTPYNAETLLSAGTQQEDGGVASADEVTITKDGAGNGTLAIADDAFAGDTQRAANASITLGGVSVNLTGDSNADVKLINDAYGSKGVEASVLVLGSAFKGADIGDAYITLKFNDVPQPAKISVEDTAGSVGSGDENARIAIGTIDTAIMNVNNQRSDLGAVSNRLNHTVNNLTNISSNLSAAKGGIEDADFALETTNLAKNQILQQASTAMLAQANASKQNVLSLLQG
jgi:flagellin